MGNVSLGSLKKEIRRLADDMDASPRLGGKEDRPEGTRYVVVSDSAFKCLAGLLRGIAREGK